MEEKNAAKKVKMTHNQRKYLLDRKTKDVIFSVYEYCSQIHKKTKCHTIDLASEMTGIPATIIQEILGNNPGKSATNYAKQSLESICIRDGFAVSRIRKIIQDLYLNGIPNLGSTLGSLRSGGFVKPNSALLNFAGFRCKKFKDKFPKIVIENPKIIRKRRLYLRKIRKFRQENRPIVYAGCTKLDLSWNENYSLKRTDSRVIYFAAGTSDKLMLESPCSWASTQISQDYREDINPFKYKTWLTENLLPKLSNESVVVLDESHRRFPLPRRVPKELTDSENIKFWLKVNNVRFEEDMLTTELLRLFDKEAEKKALEIEELLTSRGHCVIRLPKNHLDLNPLEYFWADIATRITPNYQSFIEGKEMWEAAYRLYPEENWKRFGEKVKEVEQFYWDADLNIDNALDSVDLKDSDDEDSQDKSDDEE